VDPWRPPSTPAQARTRPGHPAAPAGTPDRAGAVPSVGTTRTGTPEAGTARICDARICKAWSGTATASAATAAGRAPASAQACTASAGWSARLAPVSDPDGPVGDYGIDAPEVVRKLALGAAALLFVTLLSAILNVVPLMTVSFVGTVLLGLVALLMVRSSRVGKLRERERIFDDLDLDGHERVLDVGCGRGLLVVEAAHRLTDGHAVGVDVWRAQDLWGNSADAALANAALEGVADRVDIETADARDLPFEDGSFDVVVSSMALHNLADADERVDAIREVHRVLGPGGRAVLVDFRRTDAYVHALRACNWPDVTRTKRTWRLFPPARTVTGTKPA
jgi:arsenite methyltransferase